ncbi:hypothetical protein C6575_34170 [Nocardia seriolae]|nr:hypothetical protein C6575_34170 [Nocardia seriolae]
MIMTKAFCVAAIAAFSAASGAAAAAQPPAAPVPPSQSIGHRPQGVRPTLGIPQPPEAGSEIPGARTLPFGQQVQQRDEWCWAATGAFLGNPISQNGFCLAAHNMLPVGECPNNPADLAMVAHGYAQTGFDAQISRAFTQLSSVQQQIDANQPIETNIQWTDGNGGHNHVIFGYDTEAQTITYGDPWPTSERYVTRSFSSYQHNAEFNWFGQVYNIKKTAPAGTGSYG